MAVLSACEPSGLLAADWAGQDVAVVYLNVYVPYTFDFGTIGVGGDTGDVAAGIVIALQPTRIVITSSGDVSFEGPLFNGFAFGVVGGGAPSRVSATINAAWPVSGLDDSRLMTIAT